MCNESYSVLRALYRIENDSEYVIKLKYNNSFFTLTKVNYWRVIILQLSKLYMEDERFNIPKLLSKCRKNNYFSALNINSEFIESELNKISQKAERISHIKIQRDKLFAHEDYSRDEIVNDLTLDETKELMDMCQNIIFEIYQEVFDTHYYFEIGNSAERNLQSIIKNLEEIHNIRNEERNNIFKLLNRGK